MRRTRFLKGISASILLASLSSAALLVGAGVGATDAATPPTKLSMLGVNLASGEFAPEHLPGIHGKHYKYPGQRTAEPFLKMGMNTVRVPVRWERLQHAPLSPLDEAEMKRVDRSLQQLDQFQTIIIDLHNYGRYRGEPIDTPAEAKMLADFWVRIAQRYPNSSKIAFGLMNEPHGISAAQWRAVMDEVVQSIRAAGNRNLVLVPGTRWTGAHSWTSDGQRSNAAAMRTFQDPARNFLFEVHQYLDQDSSGKSDRCTARTIGSQRLIEMTHWLRERRAKALLGEFGASSDPTCLAALDDMLRYMSRNSDVWAGWTYWAGGDWWGDYAYSIQPKRDGGEKPQATVLRRYIAQGIAN